MFTAQQAADPGTPPQMLADIAALRADLRPIVAGNPSSYPGLLEWLGSLGEPAVDAALAARATAQHAAPPAPSGWAPAPPSTVPHQPTDRWQGQPGQPDQPAQPWQGQAAQPWQGQPAQPYGLQPAGTPPSKSGRTALIVVGVVLAVLLLIGVGGFFAVRALVSGAVDTFSSGAPTMVGPGEKYGEDPALDVLYDSCKGGDMTACDDLYDQSPIGSEYETFGDTCGGTRDADTGLYCVEN